ncbi:MAG TPA: universal stress protein [Candidatus Binatia bacterium]
MYRPFKNILVPLDGSKTAEKVLPFARSFARNLQIPVELLTIVDPTIVVPILSESDRSILDTHIADQKRRFGKYLTDIAENFPKGCIQSNVGSGVPAEFIIESAAADKDTLIAMATHGYSGLNRWLLGSVAEKVLRGSVNPVLLVRATEKPISWDMPVLKSLLVPLDGSEMAETVLPIAGALAKSFDMEVTLLRVYGVPYGAYAAGDGFCDTTQVGNFASQLRKDAEEYLERKAAMLRSHGIDKVSCSATEGLEADEIISFTQSHNLVVMCTHGRSGLKRWVLGSVTETVVRHCEKPVLIVRGS